MNTSFLVKLFMITLNLTKSRSKQPSKHQHSLKTKQFKLKEYQKDLTTTTKNLHQTKIDLIKLNSKFTRKFLRA